MHLFVKFSTFSPSKWMVYFLIDISTNIQFLTFQDWMAILVVDVQFEQHFGQWELCCFETFAWPGILEDGTKW